MARVLVDDKVSWSSHAFELAVGEFERAQLVGLPGNNEVRHFNLLGNAIERKSFHELVKLNLIVIPGHEHVASLERR